MIDISGWPTMPAKCKSCPFGPNGDRTIRNDVEVKLLSGSQICHHPKLSGKEETHLCRGARDQQLVLMHRLGWISEPTDAAFEAKSKEVLA